MQISKRIINKWGSLRDHGDVKEIAQLIGKDRGTVSRILNGKQETTSDVFIKISNFYAIRKKVVSKIINSEK